MLSSETLRKYRMAHTDRSLLCRDYIRETRIQPKSNVLIDVVCEPCRAQYAPSARCAFNADDAGASCYYEISTRVIGTCHTQVPTFDQENT